MARGPAPAGSPGGPPTAPNVGNLGLLGAPPTGNSGINVDQNIVQALGANATLQIPGAMELLGIGTGPLSLAELVSAFQQMEGDPTKASQLAAIQNDLALGGFYSKSYHPSLGTLHPEDVTALENAAKFAGQAGHSLNDYLNQSSQFGAASGFGPAGSGQLQVQAYHGVAHITDPAQVRVTMDDVFQKLLGRKATETEKLAFIKTFQGEEHNAAAAEYELNVRAQRAYLKQFQQAGGTGNNVPLTGNNPNQAFVDQANQADQQGQNQNDALHKEAQNLGVSDQEAQNFQNVMMGKNNAPGQTPSGGVTADNAKNFAQQAASIYGLTAHGHDLIADIGGPNGAAVQGMMGWAKANMGPGKLFAAVTQGPTGPNGPTVHVEFNATAGPDARQAILALGTQTPTTNDQNYNDQRTSFLESLKQTPQGGNYQWAPNPQTGGYGAYGFSQSQWAQAAAAAGIPAQDRANPTASEQDAAATALIDQYYQQYGDWKSVATAFFAGPGVASAAKSNAGLLQQIRNGQFSAQDFVNNVMSRFTGPGGGLGNAADLSSQVTDVTQPNLQAEEMVNAQTQHPAEYQANQMANQYDTFVSLLKGPEFTGRLPTA